MSLPMSVDRAGPAKWPMLNAGGGRPPADRQRQPGAGLDHPAKKEMALQLVAAAEHGTLDWRAQFSYVGDRLGPVAGVAGFSLVRGDLFDVVTAYTLVRPHTALARHLPALRRGDAACLDASFAPDWRAAAADPLFQEVQETHRDSLFFDPAVREARADGLPALGQFAYFDAAVGHGPRGLRAIRREALRTATPPVRGGDETAWLHAVLDARSATMRRTADPANLSRVETVQRLFLHRNNVDLHPPLVFAVSGRQFRIG
jgi:chitosanase